MSECENNIDFWVDELTHDINPEHFNHHENFIPYMHDDKISSFGNWMWNNGYNVGLANLQAKVNTYCASQWVSVKDRMPDNNLYVLVTYYDLGIKDCCISIGAYYAKKNVWVDDTFTKIVNVTAWMPLPQPPKENNYVDDKC